MTHPIIQELEKSMMKKSIADFRVGDTVEVRTKVVEGDKERISVFTGTVIARRGGKSREVFIVRRIVQGEGVERTFPLHGPTLVSVKVKHKGMVRRAKLYFLRDLTGKATRIKGDTVHGAGEDMPAEEAAAEAPAEKPAE